MLWYINARSAQITSSQHLISLFCKRIVVVSEEMAFPFISRFAILHHNNTANNKPIKKRQSSRIRRAKNYPFI